MPIESGVADHIRARALRGEVVDRSGDKPPPANPNETAPCQCGKRMVGRIDRSLQAQGTLQWFWWCGGCGASFDGGLWHPRLEEELVYERWKAAQE